MTWAIRLFCLFTACSQLGWRVWLLQGWHEHDRAEHQARGIREAGKNTMRCAYVLPRSNLAVNKRVPSSAPNLHICANASAAVAGRLQGLIFRAG